jgi:hypothetical protein
VWNRAKTQKARNPVVEPIVQAFLDGLAAKGGPQLNELSVEDARGALSGAQSGEVAKLRPISRMAPSPLGRKAISRCALSDRKATPARSPC